jgi:hypothetical protein
VAGLYKGRCSECGELVYLGDECPECFEEDGGAIVHDRCCQLLFELPYDYGRIVPEGPATPAEPSR